ncbi:MAG: homocysteine S-methyltransferase family protein [Clostridia bacterium]|nr:homocysteine S-methyltransferase family protein [Clostridia bacterium]
MSFLKDIKDRILIFDGSKGYMFQKLGLKGGECPELWNVTHRDEVGKVYKAYKDAGSDVIQTNSFQGNRLKLEGYSLGDRTYELNFEAARLAKNVMGDSGYVAASIGPIGKLFEPSGELTFDKAYEVFKEQAKALADGGADIINFETFTDLAEMRAALIAAKENTNLPVICSVTFEENGRTLMGTDPYTVAVVLKSLGADMVGTNCSSGPEHLIGIVGKMSQAGDIPLCVKPNAGLPELFDGQAVYRETPEHFAKLSAEFAELGVRLIGGCCGTTPEFIAAIKEGISDIKPQEQEKKHGRLITSGFKTLNLETADTLDTGSFDAAADNELLAQLTKGNMEFVLDKAMDIAGNAHDAIYISVDKASKDTGLLAQVVNTAQGYIREPFILETSDPLALEKALRLYKGKAGVIVDRFCGSVMEELIKAAKKYGSTIVDSSVLNR